TDLEGEFVLRVGRRDGKLQPNAGILLRQQSGRLRIEVIEELTAFLSVGQRTMTEARAVSSFAAFLARDFTAVPPFLRTTLSCYIECSKLAVFNRCHALWNPEAIHVYCKKHPGRIDQ